MKIVAMLCINQNAKTCMYESEILYRKIINELSYSFKVKYTVLTYPDIGEIYLCLLPRIR